MVEAHKLTWDCTHIDEKAESSGAGCFLPLVLTPTRETEDGSALAATRRGARADSKKKKKKGKKPKTDSRLWDWIEKYKSHRDAQRKGGHTPGVWVLYFALAALPLFALGQSLIDPDDDKRRRATFLQMAVYIAQRPGTARHHQSARACGGTCGSGRRRCRPR